MSSIQTAIDVEEPITTVYNQWTQFEKFPEFMEGVEKVTQLGDARLHWVAEVAGVRREWEAEITEQRPDEKVAWRSTDGTGNAGVVTFERLDPQSTRIVLQLDFEPEGMVETIGDKLGFVSKQAESDLRRFKAYIEATDRESGAWRGEIDRPTSGV